MHNYTIKFIDLFAGLGGIRIGFEEAAAELGINTKCVFTSEIKDSALKAYQFNFNEDIPKRDITKVDAGEIPEFNILLGGANSTGKCNRYYCMLSISSLRTCWTATVSKSR